MSCLVVDETSKQVVMPFVSCELEFWNFKEKTLSYTQTLLSYLAVNTPSRLRKPIGHCCPWKLSLHVLGSIQDILTYSMVQSPSWEANWFAASQEIPRTSRNPKVHYRTHKRPPPVSLSWASPIQSIYPHPTSWRSILLLSTHLCLGLPSCLLPSSFPSKTLYTPLSSTHMRHMLSPSHSIQNIQMYFVGKK